MSQRTFWEWTEQVGDAVPEGEPRGNTRGSLDWGDVAKEKGERLAQAHQLHWQLECHLGVVDLVVTDNRRRMVTAKTKRGRHRIRVHHMFLGCAPETTSALARLAQGAEGARDHLEEFIREHRDAIQFRPDDEEMVPEGEHYDLEQVLESVREILADEGGADLQDVRITWGRDGRGSKSIRFGSYDFDQRLIRVHPALDRGWVPEYFVEYIVYHELLHAVCPPEDGGERRSVHTQEFTELERQFPRYEDAVEWERGNLERILSRDDS